MLWLTGAGVGDVTVTVAPQSYDAFDNVLAAGASRAVTVMARPAAAVGATVGAAVVGPHRYYSPRYRTAFELRVVVTCFDYLLDTGGLITQES